MIFFTIKRIVGDFIATISEYMSGKICEQISLALSIMDDAPKGQLNGTKTGKALLWNVGELEPRKMKVEEAITLIRTMAAYI